METMTDIWSERVPKGETIMINPPPGWVLKIYTATLEPGLDSRNASILKSGGKRRRAAKNICTLTQTIPNAYLGIKFSKPFTLTCDGPRSIDVHGYWKVVQVDANEPERKKRRLEPPTVPRGGGAGRGGKDPGVAGAKKTKSIPLKVMNVGKSSAAGGNKTSLGDRLFALMTLKSEQAKSWRQDTLKGGLNKVAVENSTAKSKSPGMSSLDAGSERRLLELMKEAESSAVQMALAKLEDGCSIEDALAVCEPEVLNQITNWQNKLRVYLSPFLYGKRYTSFGRHFTKVDKLKEVNSTVSISYSSVSANSFANIVDRLHWYVQDGDTIVDFCCGANDFSLLMKRKLEETGKKCSFKNYDIFQAKNDFSFERKDWMTVKPKELPKGSQLIMGLNPPFGVKAALANKFIDKALEFKPKLLILIVPPETERYFEQLCRLVFQSFFLPGSVDAYDKQMDQWNVMAPPLYLWSRSDFSAKHKSIAVKHGHLLKEPGGLNQEMDIDETLMSELPLEVAALRQGHLQNHEVEECKQEKSVSVTAKAHSLRTSSKSHQQNDEKNQSRETLCRSRLQGDGKNQSKETSSKNKGKHSEENHGRGTDKKNAGRTPRGGIPNSSPSNVMGSRSSEGAPSFKSPDQHQNPNMHGSHIPRGTSYGGTRTSVSDDMGRRYNMTNDPYPIGAPSHGFGHHTNKMNREFNMRSQAPLYGQTPDISTQRNNVAGLNSGYGPTPPSSGQHLDATTNPSYRMHTSATQRYAPRLDESNHARMSPAGAKPPVGNRNASYDPRPPFMTDRRPPRPP
ncbi:hypothetical protein V6N13_085016 [Hibiscus sabdariffa]